MDVPVNEMPGTPVTAARVVADRTLEHGKDGSVEITYRVADVDELVRWVLSWGGDAVVIRPSELLEAVRNSARRILLGSSRGSIRAGGKLEPR